MKKDLRNMTFDHLISEMKDIGLPGFRGKQLFEWIHKGSSFDQMVNIPKALKEKIEVNYLVDNMDVEKVYASEFDGTKKYLLKLMDNNIIECVYMQYKHGNTLCISTQVGCRMNCSFCASTLYGLERNLTAGEMIGQILSVQNDTHTRISNIVLMGSGEPLDNYDEVLKFLKMVNHPKGLNISMRHITLSTCGLVPKIKELMKEKLQITLAVSLHTTLNTKRNVLMPVNKSYPIEELLETCKEYVKVTGRRITFEYALISGENDTKEEAINLVKLLKSINCHVNLIPINHVDEKDFIATSKENARAFQQVLLKHNIEATIRRELGADIDAACGQLRNKHINS